MILKELAEFLAEADGDTVAHLNVDSGEFWVYALPNADYTFHFSVQTQGEDVVDIQARPLDWVLNHVQLFDYVEPPVFVREAVVKRVELVEDPNALATLDERCVMCNEEYSADVTPKIDLLIDECYGQRIIEEYCPECGQSLIQRKTFNPPRQYAAELHNENADPGEVDISNYLWKHARRHQ